MNFGLVQGLFMIHPMSHGLIFFGGRLYKRSRRQSQCKVTSDSSRVRVARSVVAGLGCSFLRTSGQASCRALAEGSDIRRASIASLHGDV